MARVDCLAARLWRLELELRLMKKCASFPIDLNEWKILISAWHNP